MHNAHASFSTKTYSVSSHLCDFEFLQEIDRGNLCIAPSSFQGRLMSHFDLFVTVYDVFLQTITFALLARTLLNAN
jgi:hypothetical protein